MAVTSDAPSYLGLAPGVRREALNSYDSPQLQRDQLLTEVRAGRPHDVHVRLPPQGQHERLEDHPVIVHHQDPQPVHAPPS